MYPTPRPTYSSLEQTPEGSSCDDDASIDQSTKPSRWRYECCKKIVIGIVWLALGFCLGLTANRKPEMESEPRWCKCLVRDAEQREADGIKQASCRFSKGPLRDSMVPLSSPVDIVVPRAHNSTVNGTGSLAIVRHLRPLAWNKTITINSIH